MPRSATQNKGLVQKFHKGTDYVSNDLDSRVSFIREAGEELLREVGKRVRVRAYEP